MSKTSNKTADTPREFKRRDAVKFRTHRGRDGAGVIRDIRVAGNGSTWYDLTDAKGNHVASMRKSQIAHA